MRKELHDLRVRFFGILLICLSLFFTVAPFQKLSIDLLEGYEGLPQVRGLLDRFLPRDFVERLREWNFYINSQWFGKNFGQLVPIVGIVIGFPLFSREVERGTIAFLLSRRSRGYVFHTKLFAGLLALSTVVTVSAMLPSAYSFLTGREYDHALVAGFLVHSFFGALVWYAVAVFLSTISDDQVKPLLASLGLLAVTTAFGFLRPLRFLNTFAYSVGADVFRTGRPNLGYTVCLLVISIVLLFSAYTIFEKRDF